MPHFFVNQSIKLTILGHKTLHTARVRIMRGTVKSPSSPPTPSNLCLLPDVVCFIIIVNTFVPCNRLLYSLLQLFLHLI